jgi:2-polyprenyl-3-methyl-5-hydroxy-6-metoxy-1,4-benzoquinol methylase
MAGETDNDTSMNTNVNAESFLLSMDKHAKMFAPGARATVEANPELCEWLLDPLAEWAHAAYGDQAFEDAAKGYAKYCLGVWKAQQLYEKVGRYTPQDLPDIVSAVYEDAGYMVPYMWAAILIYPFWPSVVRHIAMYRDDFIRALPPNAKVMELACGHGVMGLLAAEEREDIHLDGLDISPPAIEIAKRLLKVSGFGDRVNFKVKDALTLGATGSGGNYQGIIAAMLAEHLEDPKPLMKAIAHYLADDGLVFFSTALESAQKDHITEFHHESEVIKLAEDVGLRATRLVCDANPPTPGARFRPRALAMILRKR